MKAVNLLPVDARRAGGVVARGPLGPAYATLGLLTVALAFVTLYVTTANTVSERRAKLATLTQQVAQEQAVASRLSNYTTFAQLAQARAATIRQIATTRFDWHAALSDLSRVVPADTSLQSLLGTVAPGTSVSGPGGSVGGGASTGSLRTAITAPAFELKGCTKTQDDVARLLSRLRVMNGVQRVTLADSVKQDGTPGGGTAAASTTSPGVGSSVGCGANAPSFDLVVFFEPLPGAGPAGPATAAGQGPAVSGTPSAPAAQAVSATTPAPGGAK